MNAIEKLTIVATLAAACSSPVQAGAFRSWLLADAPAELAKSRIITARRTTLDDSAASCLTCHDGNHAAKVAVRSAGETPRWNANGSATHPVGMSYARATARKPADYVAAGRLDPAITLVDGQVTCLSCHKLAGSPRHPDSGFIKAAWSPQARSPSRCTASTELAVGPRRTDLCLSCHVM